MSTTNSINTASKTSQEIDARGPRFGAAITTLVLATVLVTESIELLAFQTAVFAIGGFIGPQHSPYAFIYRKIVKPRLKSPLVTEDSRPPQFAQLVGFGFALTGFIALATGFEIIFNIAIAGALFAAFLNAAFAFCLGCEMYLRGKRLISKFRS